MAESGKGAAPKSPARLGAVNGLRGLAIAAVIWHHAISELFGFEHKKLADLAFAVDPRFPTGAPLIAGALGVRLFFVLSGFVLMLPYARGLRSFDEPGAVRDYYARRGWRLLPLFFFNVIVCATFEGFNTSLLVEDVAMTASTVFTFLRIPPYPRINWVLWSLGVELWFSVAFPFLARGMLRRGPKPVALAMFVLGALAGQLEALNLLGSFSVRLFGAFDAFGLGMLVAFYADRPPRWAPSVFMLTGMFAVYACTLLVAYQEIGRASFAARELGTALASLGFAAMLHGALTGPNLLATRVFSTAAPQVLGMMCYSLYVWHGVMFKHVVRPQDWPSLGVYAALLFAMSAFTYRYIEFGNVKDAARLFRPVRES